MPSMAKKCRSDPPSPSSQPVRPHGRREEERRDPVEEMCVVQSEFRVIRMWNGTSNLATIGGTESCHSELSFGLVSHDQVTFFFLLCLFLLLMIVAPFPSLEYKMIKDSARSPLFVSP